MSTKKLYFDPSTALTQLFGFPTDVIKYAINNTNAYQWLKLIKCSKYFYAKKKIYVFKDFSLRKFVLLEADEQYGNKYWNTVDEIPCDIFFADKLIISAPLVLIKPRIYKCQLRELQISDTQLLFDDFKFMSTSEVLHTFYLTDANVINSDKSIVPLENVLATLPNVTSFTYAWYSRTTSDTSINAQTFHQMASISRNCKFTALNIAMANFLDVNADDFVMFVKNHAGENCNIFLKYLIAYDLSDHFETVVNEMIETWEPQSSKPSVEFDFYVPFNIFQIYNNLLMAEMMDHWYQIELQQQPQHPQHPQQQRQTPKRHLTLPNPRQQKPIVKKFPRICQNQNYHRKQ